MYFAYIHVLYDTNDNNIITITTSNSYKLIYRTLYYILFHSNFIKYVFI